MKKQVTFLKSIFLIFGLLMGFSSSAKAQVGLEDLRKVAPNVFIDCPFCDINYIRTEITFVNYVTDRYESDVHILITRQRTGSGGMEYTIAFMGQRKYEGSDETLKYFSQPSDTEDEQRKELVRVMKLGLVKYISDTPLADFISVSFNRRMKPTQVEDKWKSWAFSVGLSGNLNGEELTKRYSYTITLSAN